MLNLGIEPLPKCMAKEEGGIVISVTRQVEAAVGAVEGLVP